MNQLRDYFEILYEQLCGGGAVAHTVDTIVLSRGGFGHSSSNVRPDLFPVANLGSLSRVFYAGGNLAALKHQMQLLHECQSDFGQADSGLDELEKEGVV